MMNEFKEPKHIGLAALCFSAACTVFLCLVADFPWWFPLAVVAFAAATLLMFLLWCVSSQGNFGMMILLPLFLVLAMLFK